MGQKIPKYILVFILTVLVSVFVSGHDTYADSIDDDTSLKGMYDKFSGKKKLDDMVEKTKEDADPSYKAKKKAQKTKEAKGKSYATILFKDSKKNQKIMYYNDQTGAKTDTVESKINKYTGDENEAKNYASFLFGLNHWNLYNVSSTQQDTILSWLGAIIKGGYGSILLGCFYLLSGLESLKDLFANLIDYLNIWKHITNGGNIPDSDPLHILNPVINIYNKLTVFFKVLLCVFMAWVAFRLATGFGKAKNRSSYFKSNGMRVLLAFVSMALATTFASLSLGVAADMLKDSKGASTSAVEKIPRGMIIDTRQYIDNSLTNVKGKKGAEGTNDGYVLNHDKGFPKTSDEVYNNLPTKELVEYMNTDDSKKVAEKLDGKSLLSNWAYSNTLNANDISTMYKLNTEAKKENNMNFLAFKLDPQEDGVKVTGGKEFFGTELKDAEVSSASLAGNSGFGVFLNALKMGAIILTITAVVVTLYLAIFTGVINALKDFFVNVSFSQMGAYQAFFGIIVTAVMLILGIGMTVFLIQLYPNIVLYLDEQFTNQLNKYDFDGQLKQLLQTGVTIFVLWYSTKLVYKVRKGVMTFVSEWFSRLLDTMNPEGSISGSRADKQALENAMGSHLYGQEAAENVADDPYGSASGFAKGAVQSVKDLKNKENEKEQSVRDLMNEKDGEGENGKTASQFSGRVSGNEVGENDADAQSEELEKDINEGIENLENKSEQGVANNLQEQERSIANANSEFEKLNGRQEELQNAKDDLAELQREGAPQDEISAAEKRVADAEKAYNDQLGKSQEAARVLSRSGASIEDIGQSKAQAMQDYHEASDEIETSEQKLADLNAEREEMEAFGATQPQLDKMDKRINQVKDNLAMGQNRQKLAQKAYEANVNNPIAEKEARNGLLSAQEGQVSAEREYQQAMQNGNLTTEEITTLQKAASSLSEEVGSMKNEVDNQIVSGEAKQRAVKTLKNNNGAAFTNHDYQTQQQEMQRAEQNVSQLQEEYDNAISSRNPNRDHIAELGRTITTAKRTYDNIKVASHAMNTGANVNNAIKSQEQVIKQAYNEKVNAEQRMRDIQSQASSGVVTDRTQIKEVESQVQQTASAYSNASRVMAGLQAVKSVGRIKVPQEELGNIESSTSNELKTLYDKQQSIGNVQSTVGKLDSGGTADIKETHALSQFQKEARRKASEKVKEANDRYKDLQQKIAKLRKAGQSGVAVEPQINRYKASLRETKAQLDRAKNKEAFISSQGFNINSIGNTMKDNIIESKAKMQEASETVIERQNKHENILKTGGNNSEQLEKYKQQIEKDKQASETNLQQLIRERSERASKAKKDLNN